MEELEKIEMEMGMGELLAQEESNALTLESGDSSILMVKVVIIVK